MNRRYFTSLALALFIPSGDCARKLEEAEYQLQVKQSRIEALELQLKAVQDDLKRAQDETGEAEAGKQAEIIERNRLEQEARYETERARKCPP